MLIQNSIYNLKSGKINTRWVQTATNYWKNDVKSNETNSDKIWDKQKLGNCICVASYEHLIQMCFEEKQKLCQHARKLNRNETIMRQ